MSCDFCEKSAIQYVRNLEQVNPKLFNILSEKFPNFSDSYSIPLSLKDRTLRKVKSSSGAVFCLCDDCYYRIRNTSRGRCKVSEAIEAIFGKDTIKIEENNI